MRIAIDARELLGRPTGIGRYLTELLRTWNDLPGAAAHEFVLCAPAPPTHPACPALAISTAVAPGSGTLWEQRVLPRLVAATRADVLLAPAYTCPLWCPVPIALNIHDVSFIAHPEWFSRREGLRRRLLTRLSARRARRIITESDFSKREICRYLPVDAARVDVIYLGATPGAPPQAGRDPLVLFVGSLFNRRHVPELIEGFARVAARVPDACLEIVGDNRSLPHIDVTGLVKRSGAPDRIHVRSYVADAELEGLYGRASVFAFLSDYEGFGLTPLEAMAAGVPVVVLDTDIAREIYGPAALFLPRPDPVLVAGAIERLLTDPQERDRLVQLGLQQIARYSWRECAQRTLQVVLATA